MELAKVLRDAQTLLHDDSINIMIRIILEEDTMGNSVILMMIQFIVEELLKLINNNF